MLLPDTYREALSVDWLRSCVQVREIYESAIESEPPNDLPEEDLRNLCVRYAQLERKLGEIDRARAIFVHGSHLADPRRAK